MEKQDLKKDILLNTGQIVATFGVMEALGDSLHDRALDMLTSHVRGDWGKVCSEDWETNDDALAHGGRVLSAYPIDDTKPCEGFGENCIWIITEHDRSVTTLLLPSEY